jgi:heme-degrading monooxygenase HmoA
VIFVSQRTAGEAGYVAMAERMAELAAQQPGYLGVRSARDADGLGLTVSYWASEADIAAWRAVLAHQAARDQGRSRWYEAYELVVARVERGLWLVPRRWDAGSAGGHGLKGGWGRAS